MLLTKLVSCGLLVTSSLAAETFSLYAYGENISGLPMYFAEGNAVVASESPGGASTAVRVSFTKGSDGLVGNPNTTGQSGNAKFSDMMLFVPADPSDHQMGFTAQGSASKITNKFAWYGVYLMVEDESGSYTSMFQVPSKAGNGGSYSLLWNSTNSDVVPVTLRSVGSSA